MIITRQGEVPHLYSEASFCIEQLSGRWRLTPLYMLRDSCVLHSVLNRLLKLDTSLVSDNMKSFIIAVNAILFAALFNTISSEDLRSPFRQLSKSVNTHKITKRQGFEDLTIEDTLDCTSRVFDFQCGSSGYAQRVVDIASGCGNDFFARNIATMCARNENGELCAAATVKFLANEAQLTNAESCSAVIETQSCPVACRTFLEVEKNRLGCCINTYINTTHFQPGDDALLVYGEYLDYRLWNLCNIELPASDCGNALPVSSTDGQTCTMQEYLSRLAQYECTASVGQPFVDAVLRNRKCLIYATALVDECGVNANGDYCLEVVDAIFMFDEIAMRNGSLLASLDSNCTSCTPECRSSINNVRDTHGCCANIFNNSDTGIQYPLLSYSAWNSCGIDNQDFVRVHSYLHRAVQGQYHLLHYSFG